VLLGWGGAIVDVWLLLIRGLRGAFGRPARVRNLWRAMPGDMMGRIVMLGCGIPAPTRTVDAGDVTAVLVEDPRVERWFGANLIQVQAQTLGRYVFARSAVPRELLAHECEHIRQWERFGPLFLALYLASSGTAVLRGRQAYRDNWFEVAARRRADPEAPEGRDGGNS
jgi:hypothetical protein